MIEDIDRTRLRPDAPVLRVREDLSLSKGRATLEGDPTWVVYDPLTQRFHELDAVGFALICEAPFCSSAEEAARRASLASGAKVGVADVILFVKQMEFACLTVTPSRGWRELWARRQAQRKGVLIWLLQNYLFIRIPLFRPDAFLDKTLPLVRLFWSRPLKAALALATLMGLFLASRQWDEFAHTFMRFLTFEGLFGYLAALVALKAFHELGHAYAAKRFGCRVPTMGVALVVLTPLLYTDVTEVWRLTSRRERLIVDAAGILVEICIAGIATLAWSLLPGGVLKSVCFFAATTSWLLSLMINLSPLMRFDGYYILSDLLDIPNLQQRAFALMRWRIRRTLFGLQDARLENWSGLREGAVFAYGVAATLYRLVLFTAIAVFVYNKTFKALGILLFSIEIGWFLLRPIASEVAVWFSRWREIVSSPISMISGLTMCGLICVVALPWYGKVEIPAVIEPTSSYQLSTTTAGRLVDIDVSPGMSVAAGQILFRLESPRIDSELRLAQSHLDLIKYRLARKTVDQLDRQDADVLERELAAWQKKKSGLERERDDLVIRAATAGRVVDIEEDLHPGRWIEKGANLGALVSDGSLQIRGYADERTLSRIGPGVRGRFIPEDIVRPTSEVELSRVGTAAAKTLDIPYLASSQGGSVYVSLERNHSQEPIEAEFAVAFRPLRPVDEAQAVLRGTVLVDGEKRSFAGEIWDRIVGIGIRESGF